MGLLCRSDWHGRWMGFLGGMIGRGLLLRKTFTLEQKPVSARAYIAGLGYYELSLNGIKAGDRMLDPSPTDIGKTILYSAYDVLPSLRQGVNVIGIHLGTGWPGTPKALFQLYIRLEDGSEMEVFTDWGIDWMVAAGPITYNSIYDGEDYDARLEKRGWDTPEYQPTYWEEYQRRDGWTLATAVEEPGGILVGDISEPVRVTASYKPVYVRDYPDGRKLFDAGINLTGWVSLRVRGERGASVRLTFAEVLDDQGELDVSYLRSARCQDSYILRGDPDGEAYAPRFTYHGFQYFTLETQGDVTVDAMTVEFARSDLKKNASFSCSDPFLNRLAQVMWQTDACNLFGIPTDCSQRDERHGWTTDTTARAEVSTYHFDMAAFFDRWLRDVMDTQDESGYFADTAPFRWGRRPCDPQVNTPASLPLLLYRMYGNRRAIADNFDKIKRYLEALVRESDELMLTRTGFGEWACPKGECYDEPYGAGAVSKHVSAALVSTGYFYLSCAQMAEMARILGRDADAQEFADLASRIQTRFNELFYHADSGYYDTDSQSSNALAIALGLARPEDTVRVVSHIAQDVERKNIHMSTGNMGTKALVEVLSNAGEDDMVYALMTQRTSPSFGYMLDNGASTLWERWEADHDNNIMNSRSHPMLGSSGVYFYKYLGGISLAEDAVGCDRLVIRPHAPTRLSFADTSVGMHGGTVTTKWQRDRQSFDLTVSLPYNTRAKICINADYAPEGAVLRHNGAIVNAKREGMFLDNGCGQRRSSFPIERIEENSFETEHFDKRPHPDHLSAGRCVSRTHCGAPWRSMGSGADQRALCYAACR